MVHRHESEDLTGRHKAPSRWGTTSATCGSSPYSPAQVVLRYAAMEDPQPPTEPEHNDSSAAIGFVDVSGFTALSEKLNKDHGRKGAELLNQYINSYFELLISGIADHGGDVIKFAGDALQVVWRNRESEPDELVRGGSSDPGESSCVPVAKKRSVGFDHLVQLALVDRRRGRRHSEPRESGRAGGALLPRPAGQPERVLARRASCCGMGVGAGELSEFYVGGHGGKWEYFVAGEPIEQMSDATEEATHGQLVLSAYAYETLQAEAQQGGKLRLVGSTLESRQYLLDELEEVQPKLKGALQRHRKSLFGGKVDGKPVMLTAAKRATSGSGSLDLISQVRARRPRADRTPTRTGRTAIA